MVFRAAHGLESNWTHRRVKMMERFRIFSISHANQSMAFSFVAINSYKTNAAKRCERTKRKNWPKVLTNLSCAFRIQIITFLLFIEQFSNWFSNWFDCFRAWKFINAFEKPWRFIEYRWNDAQVIVPEMFSWHRYSAGASNNGWSSTIRSIGQSSAHHQIQIDAKWEHFISKTNKSQMEILKH